MEYALERHPILSTLETDDRSRLADAFLPKRFADGETIFERAALDDFSDEGGEGAWVMVEGRVRSYVQSDDQSAALELAGEHVVGEILGADEALSGRRLVRRHQSATCHDEAGCEVWLCARGQLR